ncbi:MAG TPA: hypothetical protein DCZ34_01225 [Clostridiales bacterium]|nr:hypothetical protein [Clostridiales bacterium]
MKTNCIVSKMNKTFLNGQKLFVMKEGHKAQTKYCIDFAFYENCKVRLICAEIYINYRRQNET